MLKLKSALTTIVLVLIILMSGCVLGEKKHSSTEIVTSSNVYTVSSRANVVYGEESLPNFLTVSVPMFRKISQLSQTTFNIQNLTNDTINIEYRVRWKDESGFPLTISSAWEVHHFTPYEVLQVQSVGKDPNAYSINIQIRYPNNIF